MFAQNLAGSQVGNNHLSRIDYQKNLLGSVSSSNSDVMHSAAAAKGDFAGFVNSIRPGAHGAKDWVLMWFGLGSCLKCLLGGLSINGSMGTLDIIDLSKFIQ